MYAHTYGIAGRKVRVREIVFRNFRKWTMPHITYGSIVRKNAIGVARMKKFPVVLEIWSFQNWVIFIDLATFSDLTDIIFRFFKNI